MKFGIGVILYNPEIEVIDRINQYASLTENLILVDNSDKTEVKDTICKDLRKKHKNYIEFDDNKGMTNALNLIFEKSIKLQLDYVLTMDQDSDFSNESINEMLNFIKGYHIKNVAIFCPNYLKLYWNDKKKFYDKGNLAISSDIIKERDFSMTSASFIKVSALKEVIPLDNYFIGYVDNDLCYSFREKNMKIIMNGNITFEQRVGDKVKSNWFNKFFHVLHHSENRYYYMSRNNMFLQFKYRENSILKKHLRVDFFRILINILIGEPHKIKKIRAILYGIKDYKNNVIGKIDPLIEERVNN